jgi:hypothetical protein
MLSWIGVNTTIQTKPSWASIPWPIEPTYTLTYPILSAQLGLTHDSRRRRPEHYPVVATMSSEPPPASSAAAGEELAADLSAATLSKKQQKKDARKAEKAEQRQRQQQQQQQPADAEDPFAANYGEVPVEEIQSKAISGRSWSHVGDLDDSAAGRSVLIRGAAQAIRPVSKKMAFVVLRQSMSTVQCVLVASADAGVSTQMVRFATALSKESIVDVEGVVSLPKEPLKATTQQVRLACLLEFTDVYWMISVFPHVFRMVFF